MEPFTLRQDPTAIALCRALFPAGKRLPAADTDVLLSRMDAQLANQTGLQRSLKAGLLWLDNRHRLVRGRAFHRARPTQQQRFLDKLATTPVSGKLLRLLALPFKAAYVLDEQVEQATGCRQPVQLPAQVETFRWQQQITAARDCDEDMTLEADVVILGSGAGGAAAAYELACRGLAVVIIEEGQYYDRSHFTGKLTEVIPKLYRSWGATVATGNAIIPVPVGCNVGGTTTINSGTCMRTPPSVLQRWREQGLEAFTEQAMAPWFEGVERMLSVQQATTETVGPIGDLIDRGAAANGFLQRQPLMRNAQGCDGQGLCQFGCPTDAKQSTNVSYIPRALERGAFLFSGFRAERLQRQGNRITGVIARGENADGRPINLSLTCQQTIVAMGSLFTPLFLRQQGVRNPHLGRHLTLHPAGVVNALFPDRDLANSRSIPQGYGVSDWEEQGLMFEGGTIPLAGHSLLNPLVGQDWVRFTEDYPHTAYFGFMIRDTSEGRVRRGPRRGLPLIRYHMNRQDFALFKRGIHALACWYLDAGAEQVLIPGLNRIVRIHNRTELERFLRSPLKPTDFLISAYHPLGTARIAASPRDGVCDSRHRVFGYPGLSVMDGASVPTSLGANPQVTIMAMASRAANMMARELLNDTDYTHTPPQGEYA
ncbi:GMC oxidoreductase [Alcanivorax sp. HI0033]|nr:GMC oxidoreductase [Alcanivorax sp. HI0003]KZX72165.1 GMC oxidoreductase [Alcanivorax sp. HI0011]KZX78515.1 GMC oxidoreductase [Alcanivorax sp. HI0013]KZY05516.1 GMC oxidoreductase [Alcanivorax sp. HI0033]KZY11849.1 GMC oxidoreductase [Alcanivorax sp. HI0035]